MKAISMYQPWASWVVEGRKTLELRGWQTCYRGLLLIHASRKVNRDACKMYNIDPDRLPSGVLLGTIELVDIQWIDGEAFKARSGEHLAAGFFKPPLYGWVLVNPQVFAGPVPWRGRPGLFEVPDKAVLGVFPLEFGKVGMVHPGKAAK